MKKSMQGLFHFFAGGLLTFFLLGQYAFRESDEEKKKAGKDERQYQWRSPSLPSKMSFAGEAVPLDRWDVQERFDRELLFNYYNQANILFLLKLANRYFPTISERLKANGIPDDFKYLCVAESNLLSGARSRAGAIGFWQFMDGTAPGYGLKVSGQVDERSHLIKSTDAACTYLKQAYNRFGSWTAAAASYNCGMGGYSSRATQQRTRYYYDLLLPEETNRYIFRILTFKHLMENAEELGFGIGQKDRYAEVPHRVVEVTSSIPNLVQFALDNGTTYKILRLMNPWLRGTALTVSAGKTYYLNLPLQQGAAYTPADAGGTSEPAAEPLVTP